MKVKQKPSLHASWIDPDAIDVVRRLQSKGHTTYLVGGCVRDLLCNLHPKDYDIATSALPNEVRRLIYGSYVIGKRFRLVLVKRGSQQFEVATFRRASRVEDFEIPEGGSPDETPVAPVGDNFFGTPEEDALRRDFTINSLFYDPVKAELIDYSNGIADIEDRVMRMIGDPDVRIKEDPIRSLRALRLAHKLKFQVEGSLRHAILENAQLVATSVLPRRREEYLKFLHLHDPAAAFVELWDLGLLQHCLPGLVPVFADNERQEIFLHYLRHLPDFYVDSSNSLEVYTPFILGYRAAMEDQLPPPEEEELFYRNELGMFKAEIADLQSTLFLRNRLKEVELFKRRGVRRQRAFLSHPHMRLALKICQFERELHPSEVMFWLEMLASTNSHHH